MRNLSLVICLLACARLTFATSLLNAGYKNEIQLQNGILGWSGKCDYALYNSALDAFSRLNAKLYLDIKSSNANDALVGNFVETYGQLALENDRVISKKSSIIRFFGLSGQFSGDACKKNDYLRKKPVPLEALIFENEKMMGRRIATIGVVGRDRWFGRPNAVYANEFYANIAPYGMVIILGGVDGAPLPDQNSNLAFLRIEGIIVRGVGASSFGALINNSKIISSWDAKTIASKLCLGTKDCAEYYWDSKLEKAYLQE
jgi:hypothetical protein